MTALQRDILGQLRRAELASSVGAGILGAGLGAIFHQPLLHAVPFVIAIGLLVHGWGMYDQRRIQAAAPGSRVWWSEILYAVCWVALAALAFYIAWSVWA